MIFPKNVFLSPKNDFILASGTDLIKSCLMRHFGLLKYAVLRLFKFKKIKDKERICSVYFDKCYYPS